MAKQKSITRKIKRGSITPPRMPKIVIQEDIVDWYTHPILGGIHPIWKQSLVLK